jgi:hypothetical protein
LEKALLNLSPLRFNTDKGGLMVRLLTAVFVFTSSQSFGAVCNFYASPNNQLEVDQLGSGISDPGYCDEILGGFSIGDSKGVGSDIVNLRPLSYISEIGFGGVTGDGSVFNGVGNLSISNNPALVSLDGLQGIQGVGGDLVISNNSSLSDCSALAALIGRAASLDTKQGVNGDVIIESNAEGCNSVAQVLASANKPVSTMPFYLLLTLTGLLALIGSIRARVPISSLVSGSRTY